MRWNYDVVEGRVIRKKKEFLSMDPAEAEQNLKKKFGEYFSKIDSWIKSDLSIKKILSKIREKGCSFDGSVVGRWIGAYRTNLKITIVENIYPKNSDIIVSGFVRSESKTNSISFNLIKLPGNSLKYKL